MINILIKNDRDKKSNGFPHFFKRLNLINTAKLV